MSRLLDDIVICIAVSFGLLIALFLSWQLVAKGVSYPPTLISAFLGIAIAALTYRFLGGSADAQLSMGILKLGGSAALLLGTTWFVGDRLRDEIMLYSSMDTYRKQLTSLETGFKSRGDEIAKLQRQMVQMPTARGDYTIAEIRKMRPNDPFVRDLKNLVEGQEGPFRQTLRDLVVRVSVIATSSEQPRFNICGNTLTALNEGVDVPGTEVLFSRTLPDGNPVSIRGQRAGRISEDVCASNDRAVDVQINCPIAQALFPDALSSCADGNAIRGMKVTLGALAG